MQTGVMEAPATLSPQGRMKKKLDFAFDAEIQASWNPGPPAIPQSHHVPLPTATGTSRATVSGCAGGCFHHSHRTRGIFIIQERATMDPSSSSRSIQGETRAH